MSSAYTEIHQAINYLPQKIDPSISRYIDMLCGQEQVEITLSFDNSIDVPEIEFDLEYRDGKSFLNGKEATEDELKALEGNLDKNQDLKLAAFHEKRVRLSKNVQAKGVLKGNEENFSDFENGFEALKLRVDACTIKSLTDLEDLIRISKTLVVEPATIESAMQATYVTQSMNWTYNHGGQDVGVYLSEPTCPPTDYLSNTNYTILSGTASGTDDHGRVTTRVIRDVSPNAHIYCRHGMTAPIQNGMIMYKRTYSASTTSKGKVGISWLVRGGYIADHTSDPYPIGSTYALSVQDPNGDVIATGWNPYDNYVILEFDHIIAGEYTFFIHKIAERDSDSTMKLYMNIQ